MYGYDHRGGMFGGGFMMPLWWLVPVGLAIAHAVCPGRRAGAGNGEQIALDILKGRYARDAHPARPLGSDQ